MEIQTKIEKKTTRGLSSVVEKLIHSNLERIGRGILKSLRLVWRNQPVRTERMPDKDPVLPVGPFTPQRKKQIGNLLLWVPRGFDSRLIDDITGGYGYSHVTIDCGEVDAPTGKPVMIESTVGQKVTHKFLDEYGPRAFARIPLAKVGIDTDTFCACVKSKLGQPYDELEVLTWAQVDDPAKQICSDLAAVCLPDEMRQDIAQKHQNGTLRRHSASAHQIPSKHGLKEFVSPNGFAQYFGAPMGKEVTKPDRLVEPHIVRDLAVPRYHRRLGRLAVLAVAAAAVGWWAWKKLYQPKGNIRTIV